MTSALINQGDARASASTNQRRQVLDDDRRTSNIHIEVAGGTTDGWGPPVVVVVHPGEVGRHRCGYPRSR